jgi:LuxR family maltose regulon positive regulatory protein
MEGKPKGKKKSAGHVSAIARLQAPRLASAIPRTGLYKRLDSALRRSHIVWIAAAAGSGKTTLAVAYATARNRRTLWLQLDARDKDPATFFYYLREAAARVTPRARKALPLLTAEYALGLETYTRNFFEQLGQILKPPVILVFDNYHDLPENAPLHSLLTVGLRALSPFINVLIVSRNEPPSTFAALSAERRMTMLDAGLLSFTLTETRALARRYHFKRLTAEAVTNLHDRTRGWAAGTILILEEAARGQDAEPSFSEPVSHAMFDYFATEVLQRAPERQQKVLLHTALLPHITSAAASQLTGEEQAARILREFAAKGYFVYALGGREPSYQYHPLFRDFLMMRLREQYSLNDMILLYRSAASYAESDGDPEEALRLWSDVGDWGEMSRLLVKLAPVMIEQGRVAALAAWIERIPFDKREHDPWLQLTLGQARLSVNLAQARTAFEVAYDLFNAADNRTGTLLAAAAVIDSIVLEFGDLKRLDPWIERLEQALGSNPEFPNTAIELRVTSSMAVAKIFRGDRRDAMLPWIERATDQLSIMPNLTTRSRLAVYLSLDATWTGDLRRLEQFARDIASWNRALHGAQTDRLEMQYAKYVQTLYEWIAGVSDYGKTAALDALTLVESSGIHVMEHHLVARAVFGALCTGELALAAKLLERLRELAALSSSARLHMYQYHYLPGWHALLSGDYDAALRYAEESLRTSREAATPVFHQAFSACVAAYALLAIGKVSAAAPHVELFLQIAQQLDSPIMTFSGLLLRADMELTTGNDSDEERGLKTLASALSIGRTHGYRNTIVWYPAATARCCAHALLHDIETDYAKCLIRERGLRPPASENLDAWPWPVRIYTFGRFGLLRNGEAVRFEGRTQKRALDLLKALIALGGREVSEQKLCDVLWPDAEADAAGANLKVTLHRLRRLIGHDAIVLRGHKYSLDTETCWADVWGFERLASLITSRDNNLSITDRLRIGKRMQVLYCGAFLGDDDAAYILPARERLRSKWLRAIGFLAEALQHDGQFEEALAWYVHGIEVETLAEPFYQGAMRVLLNQRRAAEGLVLYDSLRRTLASQLQVAPAPETETLARSLQALSS